jgi:hypothetical protein
MSGTYIRYPATGGGGGGSVTSVSASSPLASSGGATPNISLTGTVPVANGGTGLTSPLTDGSVVFSDGTTFAQDNANLFWDDTNNWLGVGTNTQVDPANLATFQVHGVGAKQGAYFKTDGDYAMQMDSPDGSTVMGFLTSGSRIWDINNGASMEWFSFTSSQSVVFFNPNDVTIGTATPIILGTDGSGSFDSTLAASNLSGTNTGDQIPAVAAISASAIDWATLKLTGGIYTKTLAANTTFTFSNLFAGQTIVVRLTNTASNYTVTWPTVKWTGGTPPTMTVGAKSDIYTFIYDGTDVFGAFVQDMS